MVDAWTWRAGLLFPLWSARTWRLLVCMGKGSVTAAGEVRGTGLVRGAPPKAKRPECNRPREVLLYPRAEAPLQYRAVDGQRPLVESFRTWRNVRIESSKAIRPLSGRAVALFSGTQVMYDDRHWKAGTCGCGLPNQ